MRGIYDGSEFGADGLREIATRALALRGGAAPKRYPGKRLVSVFLNSSLRTRTSMEAAADNLGVHAITLNPGADAWKMEYREGAVMDGDCPEHMKDAVPILAQYADLLAVRAFAGLKDAEEDRQDPVLAAFERYSPSPVVNLESARWHPMQGFADAATWIAHFGGDVRGVPLTLTWAPHPRTLPQAVPNQVLLSASLLGMDVTLAHPEGFDLDPEVVTRCAALAGQHGGNVRISHDQDAALRGARVVYAKNWSGFSWYGRRDEEATARSGLGSWTVTGKKMALTEDAGFMHCLPVRRNVVVSDSVIDGPNSWTNETGGLRMWSAMAALERLLG